MADLFGDDSGSSGSEGEGVDAVKPAQVAVTNGHGEVNGKAAPQNGVEDNTTSADDLPPRYGGVEYEEEAKGPRDDINVSVTEYQKTADDFTFDVEVN